MMDVHDFKDNANLLFNTIKSKGKELGDRIKQSNFSREIGHIVSNTGIKNEISRTKTACKEIIKNMQQIPGSLKAAPGRIKEMGKRIIHLKEVRKEIIHHAKKISVKVSGTKPFTNKTSVPERSDQAIAKEQKDPLNREHEKKPLPPLPEGRTQKTFARAKKPLPPTPAQKILLEEAGKRAVDHLENEKERLITNKMPAEAVIHTVESSLKEAISSNKKLLKKIAGIREKLNKSRARIQELKDKNIAKNSDQFIALEDKVKNREQKINHLLKNFENSSNRLANLARQTTEYLESKEGLPEKEINSLINLRNQSYATSVCLRNGTIPPKLSSRELETFAFLHNRSLELHEKLDWNAYINDTTDTEYKESDSWKELVDFSNKATRQIKNDILTPANKAAALEKYHSYIKVAEILYQQGNLEAAFAVKAALTTPPIDRIEGRGFTETTLSPQLENLTTPPIIRRVFEQNHREGVLSIPCCSMYMSEHFFTIEGNKDALKKEIEEDFKKNKADYNNELVKVKVDEQLKNIFKVQADSNLEAQSNLKSSFSLTGSINPTKDSFYTRELETDYAVSMDRFTQIVDDIFPRPQKTK